MKLMIDDFNESQYIHNRTFKTIVNFIKNKKRNTIFSINDIIEVLHKENIQSYMKEIKSYLKELIEKDYIAQSRTYYTALIKEESLNDVT